MFGEDWSVQRDSNPPPDPWQGPVQPDTPWTHVERATGFEPASLSRPAWKAGSPPLTNARVWCSHYTIVVRACQDIPRNFFLSVEDLDPKDRGDTAAAPGRANSAAGARTNPGDMEPAAGGGCGVRRTSRRSSPRDTSNSATRNAGAGTADRTAAERSGAAAAGPGGDRRSPDPR